MVAAWGGLQWRRDVCVDPEGPEGVVEVEDYQTREGQAVGEGAGGLGACDCGAGGGCGGVDGEGGAEGRGERGFGKLLGHVGVVGALIWRRRWGGGRGGIEQLIGSLSAAVASEEQLRSAGEEKGVFW